MKSTFLFVKALCLFGFLSLMLKAEAAPRTGEISVSTPLGSEVFVVDSFNGEEGLSRLFRFQLELVAESANVVPFDALLGEEVSVAFDLGGEPARFFSGIISEVTQGTHDSRLVTYSVEMVPKLWLLTRTARSRIFQRLSVPEILSRVLADGEVDHLMEVQGNFHPREYVVQYRETDFNFVSRLMEEEGIYYYFTHTEGGHTMVLANAPDGHAELPAGPIRFVGGGGSGPAGGVTQWDKTQSLRSGKYSLRDHHFELPRQNLEASAVIQESVQAGAVTHFLDLPANQQTEIYDYPGGYAQRFDGIDPAGAERPGELEKIFEDNQRTVGIRMEEEAVAGFLIEGKSTLAKLRAGHKFSLENHPDADGSYYITAVSHSASRVGGGGAAVEYANSFECIPFDLPFRPARMTPKPIVRGMQTAFVVGPAGEEIFSDKYGRVKVQFHWDREGQNDESSSLWVRVGSLHAGAESGMVVIPGIGQEVIVAFLEGDPDRPIIVGSVYNADHLPPR